MKITIFTSNNQRHNYLINTLSDVCEKLFVIQECKNRSANKINNKQNNNSLISSYFENVTKAENKFFKKRGKVDNNSKKIKILNIVYGELNNIPLESIKSFLESDL